MIFNHSSVVVFKRLLSFILFNTQFRFFKLLFIGVLSTGMLINAVLCLENQDANSADIPIGHALFAEHIAYSRISVSEGIGGPAKEACKGKFAVVALDHEGNMFVAEPENAQIHWVTPQGIDHVIAGTGEKGFRDGPGDQAKFDFGYRAYNDLDIKADISGNIFVSDMMNKRLRKITRHADGTWHVITIAGGGTRKARSVSKFQWVRATDLADGCTTNFALTAGGDACYFAGTGGIWKIMIKENKATLIADQNDLLAAGLKQIKAGHVGGSHVTTDGIFYWMPNGGKTIWIFNENSGEIKQYAGGGQMRMDGKSLLDSGFHTVFSVYSPDASVIYTGGGDEPNVRRIFAGRVQHLYRDGSFKSIQNGNELKNGWDLGAVKAIDAKGYLYTVPAPYSWPGWIVRVTFSGKL